MPYSEEYSTNTELKDHNHPYLDHITLPSGSVYALRDARIDTLNNMFHVSTTAADTPKGVTLTPASGSAIIGTLEPDGTWTEGSGTSAQTFSAKDYIFLVRSPNDTETGTGKDTYDEYVSVYSGSSYQWEELGSTDLHITGLKGAYTPAGTVSQPTFNGKAATIKVGITPAGTVSQPTFIGKAVTISAKGTPSGTVSQPTFSGTPATLKGGITPGGSVSQPSFSGTPATIEIPYTPEGTVTSSSK